MTDPQDFLLEGERLDDLQTAGYRIIQNPKLFCFGMDAVLLSDYAKVKAGGKAIDLCTGNGIIPILLAAKTKAGHIDALEIQQESAGLAQRSVKLNGLQDRINVVCGDLKNAGELFARETYDTVTVNPPYMTKDHGLTNDLDAKTIARHEVMCTLEDIIYESSRLLKVSGHFYMVHRPFRLAEMISLMSKYGLEPKRMRLVYPYADREPNMVLIEGIKGAKPRITVEAPLIVYREKNRYTSEIYKIYGMEEPEETAEG